VAQLLVVRRMERAVKFKVEFIGKVDSSSFLIARQLEAGHFSVSASSQLGGVPIQQSLSQPRALKPDGSPDLDIWAFVLREPQDAQRFFVGQTIELES
jgi:hypothetical protein